MSYGIVANLAIHYKIVTLPTHFKKANLKGTTCLEKKGYYLLPMKCRPTWS